MTRTVRVTPAQKRAAAIAVKRSAETGKFVSDSVRKIADAKPRTPQPGRPRG